MTSERALRYAAIAFAAAVAWHGIDHALQDRGIGALDTGVLIGGGINFVLAGLVLWLVLDGHERAPQLAAFTGLYIAIGVSAAHFLPEWGTISDPYPELSLGVLSWAAVIAEVVAALLLGFAGLRAQRDAAAHPTTA